MADAITQVAGANKSKRSESLVIVGHTETTEGIRLNLAGRLTANGIGELRRQIDDARRRHTRVSMDLSEITLLDRISADFLSSVASPLIRFENCPPYLQRWIKNAKATAE